MSQPIKVEQYKNFSDNFEKVTKSVYKPGNKIVFDKPVAKISPMAKGSSKDASLHRDGELHSFLLQHDLLILEETFQRKRITRCSRNGQG